MDTTRIVPELFKKSKITLDEAIDLRRCLSRTIYDLERFYRFSGNYPEELIKSLNDLDEQRKVLDILYKSHWPVFFNVTNVEGVIECDNCISIEYAKQKYVFSNVDPNAKQYEV